MSLLKGHIVGVYGAFFELLPEGCYERDQSLLAKVTGQLKFTSHVDTKGTTLNMRNLISIGDYVLFKTNKSYDTTDIQAVIIEVLERKNYILRQYNKKLQILASNVDAICVITSCTSPLFNSGFVDRVMVEAFRAGVPMILILNKMDLLNTLKKRELIELKACLEVYLQLLNIYEESCLNNISQTLTDFLKEKSVVLIGQSGVGKSTLLNTLVGKQVQKVSEKTQFYRGSHTTTNPVLYYIDSSSSVIDIPGVREFSLMHIEPEVVKNSFSEFHHVECRYRNCIHLQKEGCGVLSALDREEKGITASRYKSYVAILNSLGEKYKFRRGNLLS